MDSRVGYPNEHLAKGSEEVTSPMFATSVGLIMKGLQTLDKNGKKVEVVAAPETITGHSEPKSTGFFDKIKKFFDEEGVQH